MRDFSARYSCRHGTALGFSTLLLSCLATAQGAPKLTAGRDAPSYARGADMQHLLHWKRMPVTVAFVSTPTLTKTRQQQAEAGFDEWVKASGGRISYTIVAAPEQADITMTLDPDATVPGQHGAAGNTSILYAGDRMTSARIELAAGHTTASQLQEVAAHEFGHALGIDGHSDNPDDLMSPVEMRLYDSYGSPIDASAHAVTARDLNTLEACYATLFVPPTSPKENGLRLTPPCASIRPHQGS